jgi:hypothetical protein
LKSFEDTELLRAKLERKDCGSSVAISSGTTKQFKKPLDVPFYLSFKDYSRNKYEALLLYEKSSTSRIE